jgi:hypothetical protein
MRSIFSGLAGIKDNIRQVQYGSVRTTDLFQYYRSMYVFYDLDAEPEPQASNMCCGGPWLTDSRETYVREEFYEYYCCSSDVHPSIHAYSSVVADIPMSSSSSTTNTTHNTNTNTTNNSIMKALYAQRQHEHQQQLELSHKQQQEEEEESARYYQQYLKSLASETTNNNPSTGITTPPSMKRTSSSSSTKNARVDFAGSITTSFSDEDDEKERSSSSLWKNLSTSLPSAPSAASATNTTTTTTNRSSLASKNTRSYVMDVQQNTHQQQEQPLRYSSGDSLGEMKISVTDMRNSLLQGRPLSTVREGMTKEVSTHNPPPPMKQKVPATTSSSSSSPKTTRSRRPAPPTLPPPPQPTLTFWKKQRERILKKWRKPPKYRLFKLCQLLSGAYIVFMSFTFVGTLGDIGGLVDPDSGWIVDRTSTENTNKGVILINGDLRAVVAQTDFQMIALAISRLSAFTMYPGMSDMISVKSVIVYVQYMQKNITNTHDLPTRSIDCCLFFQISRNHEFCQLYLHWANATRRRFARFAQLLRLLHTHRWMDPHNVSYAPVGGSEQSIFALHQSNGHFGIDCYWIHCIDLFAHDVLEAQDSI